MCSAPSATVYCADITVEIATAEPDPTSFGETARNIGQTARNIGQTARSIGQTTKKYRPDSEEISAQTAKKYRRGGETKGDGTEQTRRRSRAWQLRTNYQR